MIRLEELLIKLFYLPNDELIKIIDIPKNILS